jgi:hypothetical protein
MSCHESLMQKRRKNRSKHKQATQNQNPNSLNKSLPDLPRNDAAALAAAAAAAAAAAQGAFSPEGVETPASERYVDLDNADAKSPSTRLPKSRKESGSNLRRDVSESSMDIARDNSLTLPASTYQGSKASPMATTSTPATSSVYDNGNEMDGFFVPLVLDPNPASATSPLSAPLDFNDSTVPAPAPAPAPSRQDSKSSTRDYYSRSATGANRPSREYLNEARTQHSRSSSMERKPVGSSHIAYQEKEKERQSSDHIADIMRKRAPGPSPRPTESGSTSSYSNSQPDFKLQEAPKHRKSSSSRRNSKGEPKNASVGSHIEMSSRILSPSTELAFSNSLMSADPPKSTFSSSDSLQNEPPAAGAVGQSTGPPGRPSVERPKRGDSLAAAGFRTVSAGTSANVSPHVSTLVQNQNGDYGRHGDLTSPAANVNGSRSEQVSRTADAINGSSTRQVSSQSLSSSDPFLAPRHAPQPPSGHRSSDATPPEVTSPSYLSRYNSEEAEDRRDDREPSVLRKMSNAVKGHGRSFSDRVARSPNSQKQYHTKSPMNGSVDLGSSATTSPESNQESVLLRAQLRRAQQRIAELETERTDLQSVVNRSPELSKVDTELKEKRNTITMLDTQREMVVRELEVMTEHLKRAKDSGKPLDVSDLKSVILADFAASLGKLKDDVANDIEKLLTDKRKINDEIDMLVQMKEKGFKEYENLVNRNTQLIQHNNELAHSIQDNMKGSISKPPPQQPNGLGVYLPERTGSSKGEVKDGKIDLLSGSSDIRNMMLDSSSIIIPDQDVHDGAVITTPHVVKIKQTKPNMLRKGGLNKAFRNIKGALGSSERERNPSFPTEGMPYGSMQDPNANAHAQPPFSGPRGVQDASRPKFGGFFGGDRNGARHLKNMPNNNSNPSLAVEGGAPGSQLFGTELVQRCDFEKRDIPGIVIRCVEEVQLRGMDVEGIYRKSGGSGQVNNIRAGFEKSDDVDIGDPELEIHAVTSTLKQYFRRLPNPLITFSVYDPLLDAAKEQDIKVKVVKMREAVNLLPRAHRDCLEFLIFHLGRVSDHQADNLVSKSPRSNTYLHTLSSNHPSYR